MNSGRLERATMTELTAAADRYTQKNALDALHRDEGEDQNSNIQEGNRS